MIFSNTKLDIFLFIIPLFVGFISQFINVENPIR